MGQRFHARSGRVSAASAAPQLLWVNAASMTPIAQVITSVLKVNALLEDDREMIAKTAVSALLERDATRMSVGASFERGLVNRATRSVAAPIVRSAQGASV